MSRNQNPAHASAKMFGITLSGTVIDRTRRHVPKDNPTTDIDTYTLVDGNDRKHYVDDFSPTEYHDLGEYICVPVYIKPYLKKNKYLSYNLCIQKKPSTRGEHF